MGFANFLESKRFSPERYQKVNLFETAGTAMDVYCLLPGQSQKLHSHDKTDKYYVVLEGEATITIGDETRTCGAGWATLARPGVPHSIANQSAAPVVALVFQSPKTF